jgi:hypothetical protein
MAGPIRPGRGLLLLPGRFFFFICAADNGAARDRLVALFVQF